jgi:hypothetical protein
MKWFIGVALITAWAGASFSQNRPGELVNSDVLDRSIWSKGSSTDAMTDRVTLSTSLRSQADGLLDISCRKGVRDSVRVLVTSPKVLPHISARIDDVMYRFDDAPAVQDRWVYSSRVAILSDARQLTSLLSSLSHARRFQVRMFGSDGTQSDEVFDVSRAAMAVYDLKSRCQISKFP